MCSTHNASLSPAASQAAFDYAETVAALDFTVDLFRALAIGRLQPVDVQTSMIERQMTGYLTSTFVDGVFSQQGWERPDL